MSPLLKSIEEATARALAYPLTGTPASERTVHKKKTSQSRS